MKSLSGYTIEEKRVLLEDPKLFFRAIKESPKYLSWNSLVEDVSCANTTLKKYRRGELTIRGDIFLKLLSYLSKNQKQRLISKINLVNSNWGAIKGGKRGFAVIKEKYGENYLEMLRVKGQRASLNSPLFITKPMEITIPSSITMEIAELFGAYLGDGTLTKYFMRIAGDKRLDKYYFIYLSGLIKKNFGLSSTIKEISLSTNQLCLEIRSKRFVDYFRHVFQLKIGNKIRNSSKIPEFIIEDKELAKACLRGLMDTDGSFSRRSTYMCLAFTSHSPILLGQVHNLGLKFGYFSYKFKDQVGSNSSGRIKKYFSEVGSSNLRHIVRYHEHLKNNRFLYSEETLKYFPEYQNLMLPYYGPVV